MEKISQDKTSVDTLYDILELNVGAATNMTMKVVACGLNLVLWGIYPWTPKEEKRIAFHTHLETY